MYLATQDKVLEEKSNEVEKLNDKIISEFNALPFYKKWGKTESIRQQIMDNWLKFEMYQNARMKQMWAESLQDNG